MRKALLILLLGLSSHLSFAHKDRIEKPRIYLFIFHNQDTIKLNNPSDSLLTAFNDDILRGKKKLIQADLFFDTGERMTFHSNGTHWTSIKISDGKNQISIPDTVAKKIPEIQFSSVALLWGDSDKKAFSSSYFHIRFYIGTEKAFDKYPELQLFFSKQQFSKSTIWRQINENTRQWSYF